MNEFNIINFDKIDSTNTFLKKKYEKYGNLTLCFALSQTNGHGRENRNWFSNKGESILFSLLIKDKEIIDRFYKLSLLSAKIIRDFLLQYANNIEIKWPNDVYVNGKKICGILLESVSTISGIECLVLGIGININQKAFNKEIEDKATSLYKETNKIFDLEILKQNLIHYLSTLIAESKTDSKDFLTDIRNNNYLKGKKVRFIRDNCNKVVTVVDINDDCTLKVFDGSDFINVFSGEVTLI